jgi:hypothetical protein
MTKRHQIEIESVILLTLAAGVGVTFALYSGYKPQTPTKISLPVMQLQENPTSTPAPTLTPLIPKPQVTSQISPDGTKLLTMTVTTNDDFTKTYTFVTADADNKNKVTIYTNTYTTDSMSIPFNTWSPDDKYVFLTHDNEALVLRADGKPFNETEPTFNVTNIFTDKITQNAYHETTGWASETLLVINTKLQDLSKGPSYWFEVPSKAIIQLSSQF